MVNHEDIYRIVARKGPLIPIDIKREVGGDTLTLGAMLSELVDKKKVKLSNTKIGGTPTYYIESQADKLQDLYKYLNDKQQKAFDLLKQKKVLRDSRQEAVIRVALRDIKDFAKPLEVNLKEGKEIYWKWYLIDNSEAETLIKKDLKIKTKTVQKTLAPKKTKKKTTKVDKDKFLDEVNNFFKQNRITVVEEKVVRKGSEVDFIVKVPSPLGKQEYYCKAKSKAKCNDGDLSSAYLQGQSKKLPIIFITTGEITNKARDMLSKEFKGMILKKI